MGRKIYFLLFITAILGLIIYLMLQLDKEEIFQIGSQLPRIEYMDPEGMQKLERTDRLIIIVYFSSKCNHCQYQLQLFEEHTSKFNKLDVYFFTSEEQFFEDSSAANWRNLNSNKNIIFGIVNKKNFEEQFGSLSKPSLFFFTSKGILKEKILGEVKMDKILKTIKSLMSGQAQNSGKNNVP